MTRAQDAWVAEHETLESVEGRIHDGWPLDRLHERAQMFAKNILETFPLPPIASDARCVEIGSGVAYIMQAFREAAQVDQVTGLDISPSMIAQARARIARDGLPTAAYDFVEYDGITFPFSDASVDFFYSVAAIQHVPKAMAYKMFTEMQRCLKPGGVAVFNLMHWAMLQSTATGFRQEIENQARGNPGHWHFYYDKVELDAIFTALGIQAEVLDHGIGMWVQLIAA